MLQQQQSFDPVRRISFFSLIRCSPSFANRRRKVAASGFSTPCETGAERRGVRGSHGAAGDESQVVTEWRQEGDMRRPQPTGTTRCCSSSFCSLLLPEPLFSLPSFCDYGSACESKAGNAGHVIHHHSCPRAVRVNQSIELSLIALSFLVCVCAFAYLSLRFPCQALLFATIQVFACQKKLFRSSP